MNIAIVGPQKYDYQDVACALLFLKFNERQNLFVEVEPDGGEDAFLQFDDEGRKIKLEVQIKGSAKQISIASLADWLLHFPSHKASDTLIERLMSGGDNSYVAIVATGRCADGVSMYAEPPDWQLESHPDSKILIRNVGELIRAFKSYGSAMPEDTTQKKDRKTHVISFSNKVDAKNLKNALQRLLIVERLDETTAKNDCEKFLRTRFKVPFDQIRRAISDLTGVVKEFKATGKNLVPDARAALDVFRPEPLRPQEYVIRGDEGSLATLLTNDRALLLSGSPRIGKTVLMRWIAAEFEANGYQVKETADVETATRFLLEPVDADRLALIDDPLGGAHSVPNAANVLAQLKKLVINLKSNRRLIVAQSQDRLLQVERKEQLQEVRCGKIAWQDLNKISTTFSSGLWKQLAEQYSVDESVRRVIENAIAAGEIRLEPGCLAYLAANSGEVRDVTNLEEIERYARRESVEFGRALENEGMKPIVMALAVSTVPGEPVSVTELAFVGGNSGMNRPGFVEMGARAFTMGEQTKRQRLEPRYDGEPVITADQEEMLDNLELRRIVARGDIGNYTFSHPYYRAAAESLFDSATRSAEELVLNMVERGIFCLSPRAATSAAKNLYWIYDRLKSNGRGKIVECAEAGTHSMFPATRDLCYKFLTDKVKSLPVDTQRHLAKWVSAVTFMNLDDMDWVDGEPRMPPVDKMGVSSRQFASTTPSAKEVFPITSILDGNSSEYVSPEDAARALKYYRSTPNAMSVNATARLISYDVGLLRAEAVGAWLSVSRNDDEELLGRVFDETHPKVIVMACDAILDSWHDCTPLRQRRLLEDGLCRICSTPSAAAAVLQTLLIGFTEPFDQDGLPWGIFEAVMPNILEHLPTEVFVNDARFYGAILDACRYISTDSALKLITAWVGLLERTAINKMPSDYMLGVTGVLLKLPDIAPDIRKELISRLLQLHGTGAKLRVIADLVDDWVLLTSAERELIIALLQGKSVDVKWLKGAALTRDSLPPEIVKTILSDELPLPDSPREVMVRLEDELLMAATKIYMGNPQPLWYLGTHHSGKKIWEPIVEEIALRPAHPLFTNAWQHLMLGGDGKRIKPFVTAIGETHGPELFRILMDYKLETSGHFMPEAWAELFRLTPDDALQDKWLREMASHTTKVLDNLNEVFVWIPKEHQGKFFEMTSDYLYFQLLEIRKEFLGEDEVNADDNSVYEIAEDAENFRHANHTLSAEYVKLMANLLEDSPPKVFGTYSVLQTRMAEFGSASISFLEALETKRQFLLKELDVPGPQESLIDSWIR